MDDITLSGELDTVEGDVEAIIQSASEKGLKLNQAKCEIIMEDFSMIDSFSIFKNFIRVERKDMTLLGSPILKGKAQDQAIQRKIEELKMTITRLSLLQSHDALVLLKKQLEPTQVALSAQNSRLQ